MSIGERIREIRESKQMLQKELAYKIHVEPETISQWEHENRVPSLKRLPDIAQALGVQEAALLGTDSSNLAFFSQLGLTPDDLAGLTEAQLEVLRSSITAMLHTFQSHNAKLGTVATPSKTHSVLIVEDDQKVVQGMMSMLRHYGYAVSYALNGRTAFRNLVHPGHTSKPDVILLDLEMPEMNGLAFLKRLVTVNTTSKVIVITGHPERLAEAHLNGTGSRILKTIDKPFQFEDVVRAIEEVLQT